MQTAIPSSLPHRRCHNVCVSSLGHELDEREIGVRFPEGTVTSQTSRPGLGPTQLTTQTKSGARPPTATAKAGWCWPLTRAGDKMRGDITQSLEMSSWSGDELRTGTTLPCETWIPTAVPFLWNLTPCNKVERKRFGETCCLGFRIFLP